jgi:hypothetical protein
MKQRPGVLKRQREANRDEKQREKAAKNLQRKQQKAERAMNGSLEDPDLAGIVNEPPAPEE